MKKRFGSGLLCATLNPHITGRTWLFFWSGCQEVSKPVMTINLLQHHPAVAREGQRLSGRPQNIPKSLVQPLLSLSFFFCLSRTSLTVCDFCLTHRCRFMLLGPRQTGQLNKQTWVTHNEPSMNLFYQISTTFPKNKNKNKICDTWQIANIAVQVPISVTSISDIIRQI